MLSEFARRRWFHGATITAIAVVFVADFFTPLGISVPLLYIAGIWLAYFTQQPRGLWITAGIVSALTVAGYFLSPASLPQPWMFVANRVIAILAIWFTAFLCQWVRQALAEQARLKGVLEDRIKERTAQLSAVEERLNLALKSSEVGTWSWNVVENSIIWDDFLHPLFGLQPKTFPGRYEDFLQMLHPDDRERVTREVAQAVENDAPYDTEYRVNWPDGSIHVLQSRGRVYRDAGGRASRMTGVCWDITDGKRVEHERKLTDQRLNLALDATEVGAWDLDLINDRAWRSLRHDRVFGYNELQPEWGSEIFLSHVLPEDRDIVKKNFDEAFATDHFKMDCRVRWPDQSVHWITAQGHVYRDEKGEPVHMMGVVANIDERKRTEEQFRSVVEAAPIAMAVVDSAGRIVLVNRQMEELFGYPRHELINQAVEVLVPERYRNDHPAQRDRFFQQRVPRTMALERDLYGLRSDGSEFPVKVGLSPVEMSAGPAVICGVMDVSDQVKAMEAMRQAKEAAESASRAKSSFLANMSHEIRTPMNGIIGMAQLLSQTELRSHQRDYLATVNESAHVLLRLLNDILDFSKIEAGKLELECADFRIAECVARASQILALRVAEKGLELACRIAPEIPDHLRGDSGRVQQILVNLLGNAVKFTESGEIFVNVNAESVSPEQVRLHFSVSDTGIGIPADKLDQIFRPFEQAESSTTRRFGGTGLGLAISRQLVEMMHGRIWVESEVGRGSTFHFTAEFGVAADQHRHPPAELDSLRDLPVLVVDDNATNRRILGELLQYWNMHPIMADSAEAARRALAAAHKEHHPVRLILLDHHMPGEDGFHFVESAQDLLKSGQCTIIMISSAASAIDSDLCQKHGISRFMTKPVIASELLNEVLHQFGRFTTTRPEKPHAGTSPIHVQPRRVLLVEDNEINRRVALGLMRARGHLAVVAENGQIAVDMLSEQEFDVVLMDMQMPVMDGYEATVVIRQREHQTGGHIPIVAMTAEALKGDRERCLAAGMDDYVPKPIVPADMYRAIEQFPALCLTPESGLRSSTKSPATPRVGNIDSVGNPSSGRHASNRDGGAPAGPESRSESISELPPAGSPPAGSPPAGSPPAVDWNVAKERFGAGADSLREYVDLMRGQAPALLADLRRSLETHDSNLLRRSAHTLKGSASYFGARPLIDAATALENLGRNQSFDGTTELLSTLETELTRVLAALEAGPPDPED